MIGIHFRPGGAFPFLHLTAGELANAHVSLESLWGKRADDLRTRLLEARTPEARFAILEQTLIAQADRPLTRHRAVAFASSRSRPHPRRGPSPTWRDASASASDVSSGCSPKKSG